MPKKVLVVDSSPLVRQQVRRALHSADYEVVEAVDGVEGHRVIDTTQDLALVICDVQMPRMSGIDLLHAMQASPRHAALPVVILTLDGQPLLAEKAAKAGAAELLIKPFRARRLWDTAERLTAGPSSG